MVAIQMLLIAVACGSGDPESRRLPAQRVPSAQIGLDTVATGLEVPWAMAFAPDGRLFVTERAGRIRVIDHGMLNPAPWATLDVDAAGESGLMGIALPPDFLASHELFVVATFRDHENTVNRVVRFTEQNGTGTNPTVVFDGIPSGALHAGDAVAFGPDGMLYVATGDARSPAHAQETASLAGKILRLTRDGRVPPDNPDSKSPVYARGFRNPQGLAWDPTTGQLFATEHGPSGFANELGRRDHDELNAVVKGGNFGWPIVAGSGGPSTFLQPIAVWTPAIAPSGLAVYNGPDFPEWRGNLFIGALRGEQLRRMVVTRESSGRWRVTGQEALFDGVVGRIRAVTFAPDGHLYFSLSNRDGRGSMRPSDDMILRVVRRS